MWVKVMDVMSIYGFPGVVVGILFGFLFYMFIEHKKERKEWLESEERRTDKLTTAVDNSTALLHEMKGLFQAILQKK